MIKIIILIRKILICVIFLSEIRYHDNLLYHHIKISKRKNSIFRKQTIDATECYKIKRILKNSTLLLVGDKQSHFYFCTYTVLLLLIQ